MAAGIPLARLVPSASSSRFAFPVEQVVPPVFVKAHGCDHSTHRLFTEYDRESSEIADNR